MNGRFYEIIPFSIVCFSFNVYISLNLKYITHSMKLGLNKAFNLLADKLQTWINTAIQLIPNIVAAILILLVFFGIGWLIRKVVTKTLHQVTSNKAVISLLETISGIFVVAVGVFIALGVLQLDGWVTTLLAGAGVIGLALGFAFQSIAANFISGIILSIRHPFGIGDMIESNDYYGYVHEINLRCTIIRTTQGQLAYIPNQELLGSPFVNYTWNNQRRVDLECGVSQGDDLRKAKRLAIEAVESIDNYNSERDVELFYTSFGASSMDFVIRFWVHFRKNPDFLSARSEAIMAIRDSFDENNISTPFPIRTLDFAMKGGKRLNEELVTADKEINSNGN